MGGYYVVIEGDVVYRKKEREINIVRVSMQVHSNVSLAGLLLIRCFGERKKSTEKSGIQLSVDFFLSSKHYINASIRPCGSKSLEDYSQQTLQHKTLLPIATCKSK